MKPYGGYIPKNLLDGEDEYIEFYKADEVNAEIEKMEREIEKRDEDLRKKQEELEQMRKKTEEITAKMYTVDVIAHQHSREMERIKSNMEILREALGFYATESNWYSMQNDENYPNYGKFIIECDRGKKARECLKRIGNP
jgi:septal ring factor EnvC (AmiA/AmiB activator)